MPAAAAAAVPAFPDESSPERSKLYSKSEQTKFWQLLVKPTDKIVDICCPDFKAVVAAAGGTFSAALRNRLNGQDLG